jgi:hypothetical protein
VLFGSTHFKASDGSEKEKWIKNGLNMFYLGTLYLQLIYEALLRYIYTV